MKLLIVLATVTLAQAGRLGREYLPPNSRGSPSSTNKLLASGRSSSISQTQGTSSSVNGYAQNTYSGFESGSNRAQASLEGSAAVLRLDNKNDGETYSFAFETDNGFTAEETGVATNGVQAQGGYSYTGDDGKVYSIRYTADENGFVPQGDHIPTSPPIPEEILKALEQNARDEAAGIFDDGIYNEAKYAASSQQQYYKTNAQPINNNKISGAVQKTYLPPSTQRNNYQRNGY